MNEIGKFYEGRYAIPLKEYLRRLMASGNGAKSIRVAVYDDSIANRVIELMVVVTVDKALCETEELFMGYPLVFVNDNECWPIDIIIGGRSVGSDSDITVGVRKVPENIAKRALEAVTDG